LITLALDASTYQGSVALLEDRVVRAESGVAMRGRDEERLMPAVAETLRQAGVQLGDVDRIVCGDGPGSFTSLRIAASLAKGMATGASKPLFAVSSLALIVAGNVDGSAPAPARYLAVLDALRGESFIALIEHTANAVSTVGEMRLVRTTDVAHEAAGAGARPVGPALEGAWAPLARGVRMMTTALDAAGPVALTTWEPVYGRLAEAQAKWERAHAASLPR